jgi:hypothetical protein
MKKLTVQLCDRDHERLLSIAENIKVSEEQLINAVIQKFILEIDFIKKSVFTKSLSSSSKASAIPPAPSNIVDVPPPL